MLAWMCRPCESSTHPSNQGFSKWLTDNGFEYIKHRYRSAAIWLAQNWSEAVRRTTPHASVLRSADNELTHPTQLRKWFNEQKTTSILPADLSDTQAEPYDDHRTPPDITHPTNLRRWFNEQKQTALLPADLADIQAESIETVVLDERWAEVGQTVRRHIEALAKKHNTTPEKLEEATAVAADVCRVLGLDGYASVHTKRLDTTECRVLEKTILNKLGLHCLFDGRSPRISLVSESGLYKLIRRRNKPASKAWLPTP